MLLDLFSWWRIGFSLEGLFSSKFAGGRAWKYSSCRPLACWADDLGGYLSHWPSFNWGFFSCHPKRCEIVWNFGIVDKDRRTALYMGDEKCLSPRHLFKDVFPTWPLSDQWCPRPVHVRSSKECPLSFRCRCTAEFCPEKVACLLGLRRGCLLSSENMTFPYSSNSATHRGTPWYTQRTWHQDTTKQCCVCCTVPRGMPWILYWGN